MYEKIKSVSMLEDVENSNNRYYVINKNVVIIEEKVLFEITLSYAQENVTKFDRFIVYSLYDVKNNYSIQTYFKSTIVIIFGKKTLMQSSFSLLYGRRASGGN